jgi:hypothetical protein
MNDANAKTRVTPKAMIRRINRRLRHSDLTLKTTRGFSARCQLGDYWIKDVSLNAVARKDVDLAELAGELEVLASHETLDEGLCAP